MADIDRLELSVEARATKANRALDTLVTKLGSVSTALSRVNSSGLTGLSNGINKFANASLNLSNVKTNDFTRMIKNINALSSINTSRLYSASSSINSISRSLSAMTSVGKNAQKISELASNINTLGQKKTITAADNIPKIATSLSALLEKLSKAPKVSNNVINLTNAIANLTSQGSKVGTSSRGIARALGTFSSASETATRKSFSLSSAIGKIYQSYFMVFRMIKKIGSSVVSSMNYIEEYNYFNVTMGKIGKEWQKEYSKYGYDNAEAYAESFESRMNSLTSKMTGYNVNFDGTLSDSGLGNLGLDVTSMMNYEAGISQVTNSLKLTGEASLATSKALTMLAGDMSSFRNVELSTVMNNLQSGLIGQSRALYKYGIDITNATLATYAYKYGVSQTVSEMTQGEKMQLRVLAILDQSKVAWGDLANTINSPSNQLRLLKNNIKATSRTIGNILLPTVAKVLPYVNGLAIAIRRLFEWCGKMLGIDMSAVIGDSGTGYSDIFDGIGDGADDTSDSLDKATSSAKELKNELMGFDEINKLSDTSNSSSGSSGSGGSSGGLDLTDKINAALADYEKVWNSAFDRMDNKAEKFANNISDISKKIIKKLDPVKKALKNFWNDGFADVRNFSSTALKDFYKGFLVPISKWTIGTGIPKLINALNTISKDINWNLLNKNLKLFWQVAEPFVEGIGEGVIDFFEKFGRLSATGINLVGKAISGILTLANKIPPNVIKAFGNAVGELIGVFLLFKGMTTISAKITGIGKAFSSMFILIKAHPILALTASIAAFSSVVYDFFEHPLNENYGKNLEKQFGIVSDSVKKSISNIEDSINSYQSSAQETMSKFDYIQTVADKYIELSANYSTLTDEQKQLLKSYADILKDNVEGVEEYIDPITNAYAGTKAELDELISKTKKYYLVLGAKNKLTEFGTMLANNSIEISKMIDNLNSTLNNTDLFGKGANHQSYLEWAAGAYDKRYEISSGGLTGKTYTTGTYKEVIDALERVNYRYNSLTESEKECFDALYKYDEMFAMYMDHIGNAPEDIYQLEQSSKDLSDQMSDMEEIIASNGETVANVSTNVSANIDKVSKNYEIGANKNVENSNKSSESIKTAFSNMYSNFSTFIQKIHPDIENMLNGMNDTFNSRGSGVGATLGAQIGLGINNGIEEQKPTIFSTIDNIFSKLKIEPESVQKVMTGLGSLPTIALKVVRGYATGGFPEDGWFRASRGELMGKFDNGQSVVANNQQITDGISAAVYKGNQETNILLRELIDSVNNSSGDTDIVIDGKTVFKVVKKEADNYTKQTGKEPFPT